MLRNRRLVETSTGRVFIEKLSETETRWESTVGLLGKNGLEPGEGLYIPKCSSIHTCFMKFAIDVAFVDAEGLIIKIIENLRPWKVAFCSGAVGVFEAKSFSMRDMGLEKGINVTRTYITDESA